MTQVVKQTQTDLIDEKDGELVITGIMRENGEEYAQWNSEIACLRDRFLYIYYNMEQLVWIGRKDIGDQRTAAQPITNGQSP